MQKKTVSAAEKKNDSLVGLNEQVSKKNSK